MDPKTKLKEMKILSLDKLMLRGHVSINPIRNKFDFLVYVLDKNVDIFLIWDKFDDSFPSAQFKIGFTIPYRYNRNDKGIGLLLHIGEDIPSRLFQCKSQYNTESLSYEIIFKKRKWFLNCSWNPYGNSISRHRECLNASLMNMW